MMSGKTVVTLRGCELPIPGNVQGQALSKLPSEGSLSMAGGWS